MRWIVSVFCILVFTTILTFLVFALFIAGHLTFQYKLVLISIWLIRDEDHSVWVSSIYYYCVSVHLLGCEFPLSEICSKQGVSSLPSCFESGFAWDYNLVKGRINFIEVDFCLAHFSLFSREVRDDVHDSLMFLKVVYDWVVCNVLFDFFGGIDLRFIFPDVEILNERILAIKLFLQSLLFGIPMIENNLKCEVGFKHPATFEVIWHPVEHIWH